MSIKYPTKYGFKTAGGSAMLGGATEASYHLKFRLETEAVAASTSLTWIFGGAGYMAGWIALGGSGTQPGTVKVVFTWRNATGASVNRQFDLATGAAYALGMVFSQATGHRCYINGQRTSMGALPGALTTANISLGTGIYQYDPTGAIFSVEDVAVWKGHALTDQQVADLRDGVIGPAGIASGSWRGLWTMRGTDGATAVAGAGGLLNSVGDNLYPMDLVAGSGTAVYGPEMAWEPTAEVGEAWVGTGGRTLFCSMRAIASGDDTLCQSSNFPPEVKVGGVSIGQASLILADKNMVPAAFLLPRKVEPGEVVTMTAPANWISAVAGAAAAVEDGPVVNHSGESCFRGDDFVKTLRMGVNTEFNPIGTGSGGEYLRNWSKRLGYFRNVATWDEDGKPTSFSDVVTSVNSILYDINWANGIDDLGSVGPTGLFAIGWDDTNPGSPTTFKIFTMKSYVTVTARPEYDNPGTLVGGVLRGIVKVYEVSRKAGSRTYATSIAVQLTNMAQQPRFENLIINHEMDFTPGSPTVLDNSDPFALSQTFLDRFAGTGSIRAWTPTLGGLANANLERGHMRPTTDFSWSGYKSRASVTVRYTEARPYVWADTPWMYLFTFGQKYAATLATGVDASTTTFQITQAAGQGNQLLIGSRLFLGSEVCRITALSGTHPNLTATVIRGIEWTTPASHSAGAIEVGYRLPIPQPGTGNSNSNYLYNGSYFTLVSVEPHRLTTAAVLPYSGSWPTFTYADGKAGNPSQAYGVMMVTGPNTMLIKAPPWNERPLPLCTLPAPIALDPLQQYSAIAQPAGSQLPYAMHCKAANQLDSPSIFFSMPTVATDDQIYWIAEQVRDNLDVGRLIYIEDSNEIWNFYQTQGINYLTSNAMYPEQGQWTTYLLRTQRIREIFEQVLGPSRAADLRMYVNQQATLVRSEVFTFAAANGVELDALALAPYFGHSTQWTPAATMEAWSALDVPELMDCWIHHMWHATGSGPKKQARDWKVRTDAYTAATGRPIELVSYEGGFETILKATIPEYVEKERDFFYHPNMVTIGQDLFALLQSVGYVRFNYFCSFDLWQQGRHMWGIYKHHYHPWGYGDGSDGKANNLDCEARQGRPNSKSATTHQDYQNVSTLGQAWLDWNGDAVDPPDGTVNLRGLRIGAEPGATATVTPGTVNLRGLEIVAGGFQVATVVTQAQKIARYIGNSRSLNT